MDLQNNQFNNPDMTVAVVGAGLVGALNACYLAKRGVEVHVYEFRDDIRTMEHVSGRSINLALSARGRAALDQVGLETSLIQDHGIPMYARMIHGNNGSLHKLPYGKRHQCIYSVGRRHLNETMLNEAEKHNNVKFHFSHKLISADLEAGSMTFENNGVRVEAQADLILGCDGAFSSVRRQMMKLPRFNYSQTYIPHGYMELCIPPTYKQQFAMEPNFLHIWPRGEFMMIALPNQDRSWTVTLFMPFTIFQSLKTSDQLLDFFNKYFRDSIELIGADKLISDFFRNKPLPMVSIKCSPYHVSNKAVIMGDAAHAMVPFYGQGMNAGFEDCYIMNALMDKHFMNIDEILPEYSSFRQVDAEAICDLAMYNYKEMRDLVNSRVFTLRRAVDKALHAILPGLWTPLYTMVSFSRVRYHKAIIQKQWQDKVLRNVLMYGGLFSLAAFAAYRHGAQIKPIINTNMFNNVLNMLR